MSLPHPNLLDDLTIWFHQPGGETMAVYSTEVKYMTVERLKPVASLSTVDFPRVSTWVVKLDFLPALSRRYSQLIYGGVNPHSGLIYYHVRQCSNVEEFERGMKAVLEMVRGFAS